MLVLDIPDLFPEDPGVRGADSVAEERADYPPDPTPPAPVYAEPCLGVRLYRGDALELLRRARSEMFDLIFADPPYFLSNGGVTCKSGRMVSVNKGKWDRSEGIEADHAFNVEWLRECRRLLKPDGTLWVSGTSHNIYSVGYALQTLGYKILNDIAWYKVNPPPNLACRRFTHATETLLWAARGEKSRYTFHYSRMKAENGGKQMQSLWHIRPPGAAEKRHGKHPTQKPEALLERVVLAASNEGDLVLDPFCGSGTTGVACARHGRRFVGIERESSFFALAVARLNHEGRTMQTIFVFTGANFAEATGGGEAADAVGSGSWQDVVCSALSTLGGEACLKDLNSVITRSPRTRTNPTWPATVRRVVRQSACVQAVGRGRYRLIGGDARNES